MFNIFKANFKSTCCCQKYQNHVQGDSERILISLEILAKLLFFNREIRRATAIRTSLSRSQRREIGWIFFIVKNKHILVSLSPPCNNHHYHYSWKNHYRHFIAGLAMMLLCVVLVFFLCDILALVVNVLEVLSH